MRTPPTTPWHRASFDEFLYRRLPLLLRERLGLRSVRAEAVGTHACRIALAGQGAGGPFEVEYPSVPMPDAEGVFRVDDEGQAEGPGRHTADPRHERLSLEAALQVGQRSSGDGKQLVVVPRADRDDLATARVECVGEQLYGFIESRLGQVPEGVDLDETLVARWLPLDAWVRMFLKQSAQVLNGNNWLDRATHLRRVLIPDRTEVFAPGHFGRTCPFETPEGPNIGRVLTVSTGAEIRDGRLVVVDEDPVAGLGLGAASIPFLEHDDGNRVLMGTNMMRQWLAPAEAEPPWVQTGLEPEVPGFWCGRNLLTAFVSWDGDAHEDGLLISETAARKLACPEPLEPGDKMSNRHGTKGVVSRVQSDDDMPRLPDGTAVELVYSVSGVPSRWTVGQLREAALSHVARNRGRPAIVPPFQAPTDHDLRRQLRQAGLPETGMMTLTDGGVALRRPCAVGWVYWGSTVHLARGKLRAVTRPEQGGQRIGPMEVQALREAGAEVLIQELTNTCSAERIDAGGLADRVASGAIEPAPTPSPRFAALAERLARVGIRADADASGVSFREETDGAPSLALARAVPHPWLPDSTLTHIHMPEEVPGFDKVADGNARLAGLLDGGAPRPLVEEAHGALARAVAALYDGLVSSADLMPGSWALFSGRTVLAPGPELRADRLGLPQEMAWVLFGPLVARELGDPTGVEERTDAAAAALARVMDMSWVVLNRAPSVSPTSLIAFRPVLCAHKAIRLPPLACRLLNADFDGDQAAVFLPLTSQAQQEAGEKLSIAGHLRRDPNLVEELYPGMDALFGLACLSRTAEGLAALAEVAGREPDLEDGILTDRGVARLLREAMSTSGPEGALRLAEELARLGFEAARREGGSVGPFVGASLDLPAPPDGDAIDQWEAYTEELWALVAGFRDYDDPDVGAVCLLSHSGARASAAQVSALVGPGGLVHDVEGNLVPVRCSWREGLTAREAQARVAGARRGLHRAIQQMDAFAAQHDTRSRPTGFGVISRARRCCRPGVVFARAARRQEVDPLRDDDARFFVGLPRGG